MKRNTIESQDRSRPLGNVVAFMAKPTIYFAHIVVQAITPLLLSVSHMTQEAILIK